MKFNEEKCKIVHFGYDNLETSYSLNNVNMSKSAQETDLGVTVSNSCKPSEQCAKAAKRAMQRLGLLKRTFRHIDIRSFKVIYPTYVRPLMEYAVQSWNPYYIKDIECLERVQRYATRLVTELSGLGYEERLERLDLYTLKQRRLRGDLIETYKILSGKYSFNSEKLFRMSDVSATRGHHLKVYKPALKKGLLLRKNFFNIRIVNTWNELPQWVVSASTVETFKKRLDHHWNGTIRHGTQEALPNL